MGLFNKLPGFQRAPPGMEREILRRIPAALTIGLAILVLPSLYMRLAGHSSWNISQSVSMVDIYAMGAILFYCNVIAFIFFAALIVMLMKGPAYVADAYDLSDADSPRKLQSSDDGDEQHQTRSGR